ncbi:MAG: ribonuclease E/G, partial [Rickettsiella sp.]|nr:ribonuclease E/G [Rickettsiella sp.]
IEQVRPDFLSRITFYHNPKPLFLHYDIEEAAESAFQREIRLASGGTIVIDRTEALVAIDINSGRSTKNGDIEETAIKTNLEAAKEIAHQLRVRDLGGLIVIDFIDMNSEDNKRKVENCLREATKKDRARIQISRISAFGLLEMSRQRLRHSLGKANETLCSHCNGQGTVRSIESLTLSLLRLLEEEALKKSTQQIRVELPVAMATYLINEKRAAILKIEERYKVTLLIIPNPYWESPQYKITALNKNAGDKDIAPSYETLEDKSHLDVSIPYTSTATRPAEVPAVKSMALPPKTKSKTRLGLLSRLFSMLTDLTKPKKVPVVKAPKKAEHYPSKQLAERRYGKTNRNNRSRPRRERGPQNHRYSTAPQSNNRYEQTQTNPSSTERRPQAKKKIHERIEKTTGDEDKLLKQPMPQSLLKKTINFAEKQALKQATEINQTEVISNPTTPITEEVTPIVSSPLRRKNNTRRYGGEPKLRHRNYAYEVNQAEKDK